MHGRKAYEELIDSQLRLATSFASWVQASQEFELTAQNTLPIVTFRLKGPRLSPARLAAAHASIVDEVTRDGQRWISETVVNGRSVMRMMVISYLTEERHLRSLETALTNAANELISRAKVG